MSEPEAGHEETGEEEAPFRTKRRTARAVLIGLALLLALALLYVWSQRQPIAERFVQQELTARGVKASYQVTQIALRTQRIENLVLGDPARPDLTARSIEVDLGYGGLVPRVVAVRARGVRLYGKVTDKGLQLGELDKFRDPASSAPFDMPDIDLTLDDTKMRLETPVGPVGMAVQGQGNLRSGFAGKIAAILRDATVSGCTTPQATAYVDVRMTNGTPRLTGPVRADALRCGAIGAAKLAVNMDVTLSRELASWQGRAKGGAEAARGQGATVAHPSLDLHFSGDTRQMRGKLAVQMAALGYGDMRTGPGAIEADWSWNNSGKMDARGRLDMADVRAVDAAAVRNMVKSAAGTPVGPLAARLAAGLRALQSDNRLTGQFAFDSEDSDGRLSFSTLELAGAKGSRVALSRDSRFVITMPDGRWALVGGLTVGGGGLPDMALRMTEAANGSHSGQIFLKPYAADAARLEADMVRFRIAPDGTMRLATRLRLDGPMPDGYVRGLDVPLAMTWSGGALVVNPSCAPVRFSAFKTGAMRLDGATMQLCPSGSAVFALRDGRTSGGANIAAPRLTGRLGDTAMQLSARSARYDMGKGGFDLTEAAIRLGGKEAPVLLSADLLEGATLARGLGGRASGINARIGTVPLLVRDGAARWAFVDDALALDGSIIVYDDANPDRFNPLESSDFRLTLAAGRIDAQGSLHLPGRERKVASVTVRHILDSGVGHADLTVDALRFDKQLQPDELTHTALGVIANVQGVVNGTGRIDWTPDQVSSSGDFATEGLNLAAAFGPVEGLSTRVHFTDLIGLVTAPGQEMRLASANPGIEVRDGVIRYALLPGQRAEIEGGRWPFAGGELTLLPSIMDFSAEKPRYLTFRVLGLDAGSFIQMLELDNVSATGTFDGLLPMVFDAHGGRIVGGILTARQSGMPPFVIDHVEGLDIPCDPNRKGGNLAYVGQVSNENLGRMGRMAFDALKDLQYKCLTILMDGAIDGEIVTQVAFNGVNRGELSTVPKPIAAQFVGLPFIFNIKIEAPFRGLMNTARSFIDPSLLIRQHLGDEFTPVKQNRLAVQPSESETMPPKERQ
tara:strand:- start:160320 stop:163550 length:3231 start_codon:yes stop_codon:yes gene_type:complete